METVIAIGVVAVLLTGFLAVFTPAAQGIRRSISSQQANRLTSTLERELVTLREDQPPANINTGFEKAFAWIQNGDTAATAIFVYQYRGESTSLRPDGTPRPMDDVTGQPGSDYTIQSIARRADDPELTNDLKAIDGAIFYVKPTQLVYTGNEMVPWETGEIVDPKTRAPAATADAFQDAVIAFSAEFYSVPSKSSKYLTGPKFAARFDSAKKPVFTRNLAIRR
jgi:type II secretory pathway pseudopilin PulG